MRDGCTGSHAARSWTTTGAPPSARSPSTLSRSTFARTPEDSDAPRPDQALAACLAPLLARVPDTYRSALELTELGGLTQDQAATQLKLSTSGMKSRVQRGRRMLRDEVVKCCRIELDARGALSEATTRDDTGAC